MTSYYFFLQDTRQLLVQFSSTTLTVFRQRKVIFKTDKIGSVKSEGGVHFEWEGKKFRIRIIKSMLLFSIPQLWENGELLYGSTNGDPDPQGAINGAFQVAMTICVFLAIFSVGIHYLSGGDASGVIYAFILPAIILGLAIGIRLRVLACLYALIALLVAFMGLHILTFVVGEGINLFAVILTGIFILYSTKAVYPMKFALDIANRRNAHNNSDILDAQQ